MVNVCRLSADLSGTNDVLLLGPEASDLDAAGLSIGVHHGPGASPDPQSLRQIDDECMKALRAIFAPSERGSALVAVGGNNCWQDDRPVLRHKFSAWMFPPEWDPHFDHRCEPGAPLESPHGLIFSSAGALSKASEREFPAMCRRSMFVFGLWCTGQQVRRVRARELLAAAYRVRDGSADESPCWASLARFTIELGIPLLRCYQWLDDSEVSVEAIFPRRWLRDVEERAAEVVPGASA